MAAYDAIVIGGGIQGAAMALECSRRGRRPLLIERDVIGMGASGASFGLIHGGLRYLQSLDIARWRRSRRAQLWFQHEFPNAVRPLRCVMPIYRRRMRSRSMFGAAFALQRMMRRLAALEGFPDATGFLSASETRALYPICERALAGAAYWDELVIADPSALLRSLVDRVVANGGTVLERQEATALSCSDDRIAGVFAREPGSPRSVLHSAPTVVICAGAQSQALAARFDRWLPAFSANLVGFNILLDAAPPAGVALALSPNPGRGRSLFLRDHDGRLLVGTAYEPASTPDERYVSSAAIERFRAEVVQAVPSLAAVPVIDFWSGRLPDLPGRRMRLRHNDLSWDHGRHGGPRGLYTVMASKLTTAHSHACDVLDRVWSQPHTALAEGRIMSDTMAVGLARGLSE